MNPLIAAQLAAPKTHKVVTTYADGATKEHLTASLSQARNWAIGESRKIGRDLIDRATGKTVRVANVEVQEICLVEGWTRFSETWPRSGMMQNGTAYQLPPLALLTDETASGLWPTPRANDAEKRGQIANDIRNGLPAAAIYWPTPTARDYRSGRRSEEGWQKRLDDTRGWQLNDVVARFPTLTANRRSGLQSHGVNVILGLLNPTWVEWLMGFPAGWTALSSSATRLSRKSRKSSGGQS